MASSVRTWGAKYSDPFLRFVCTGLCSLRQRGSMLGDYGARCGPVAICKKMLTAYPWLGDIRRATSFQLRRGILRVKEHMPRASKKLLVEVAKRPRRERFPMSMAAPAGDAGRWSHVVEYD